MIIKLNLSLIILIVLGLLTIIIYNILKNSCIVFSWGMEIFILSKRQLLTMKKIIITILFTFLILGIVGAADNVQYSNETQNITFEGIDFTIPEGFGESKDAENYDGLGSEGQTCFYINQANGEIIITVISDWMGMSLEELEKEGATKTRINGHEGWNYTQDNLHYFAYVHDDKGILVGVTNQTRLYEIIL